MNTNMPRVYLVPSADWTTHLATALQEAQRGDWVLVANWDAVTLGNNAANRTGSPARITTHEYFLTTIRRDCGIPDVEPIEGEWVTV